MTSVPTASAVRALPSVTALICTYNYAAYIGEAIDSALAQEYPHELLEVLVVDDGSTDRTPEVLEAYVREHGDRVRVISQPNAGVAAATARGIAEARGELIALLDADDAWLPQKTRRQVELLRARPETGLVHGDMELVDRHGRRLAPSYWRQYDIVPVRGRALASLLRRNAAVASTLMFRRSLAPEILPYPDAAWSHDWWIAVRTAAVAQVDFVAEPVARHRNHDGAMTKDFVRVLRRDVGLQRQMLRQVDLATVSPREMRAAWDSVWDAAKLAQSWTGRPLAEEVPVTDADRAEWLTRMTAAGAAAARGEAHASAAAYVAALACDPYAAATRDALDAVVDGALIAGPLLPAGTDGLAREARVALAADRPDRAAQLLHRALEPAPGHPGLLAELAEAELARARWADAAALLRHAAAAAPLAPRSQARLEDAERRAAAVAPVPPPVHPRDGALRGRVLLCADTLAPDRDGSEALAGELALALRDIGWDVEIATRGHVDRTATTYDGMPVHEMVRTPVEELRALVDRRHYDAVLAFSSPLSWPIVGALRLPASGPRVVALTAADVAAAAELRSSVASLASFRALLQRAAGVATVTQAGPDARLMADLGVTAAHVAVTAGEPAPGSAPSAAAGHGPLLVAVGDLTPANGYGPLLRALSHHEGDWRLVIAGRPVPAHRDVQVELERLASADRRVTLVGDADPAAVSALIAEAAVLLAPAVADAWGAGLAEAMRHGVPWIATPGTAPAQELPGGLVLPLEDFPAGLELVLGGDDAAERLGAAGREHWEALGRRPVLAARLDALLRGLPIPTALAAPAGGREDTDDLRRAAFDRAEAGAADRRYRPLTLEVTA